MLIKKRLAVLTICTLALAACGSDNDNAAVNPSPADPEPTEKSKGWDYIETPYFELKDTGLKGNLYMTIGTLIDNVQPWLSTAYIAMANGDASYDQNGDGLINHRDPGLAGISNEEVGPTYTLDTQKMIDYLATNPDGFGAGTSRPDIFVEGHYNAFDVLRYTVATRDDMRFEGDVISYKDSKYNTFEFRLSWDSNGDGEFNSNDGEYYNSDDWHFASITDRGQTTQYGGMRHDYNYQRMDTFWVREATEMRFLVHDEVMTNRRHWIWQREQDRTAANNGKFIVPLFMHIDLNPENGVEVVANNIEVTAYNVRSDVFQPGVITAMDVWMSLAEQQEMDIRFSWWPVMNTGAIVNSFAMMHNPWKGAYGGWVASAPIQGELEALGDFDGLAPMCNINLDGTSSAPGEGQVDPETCTKEWLSYRAIGGATLNDVSGSVVLPFAPEVMMLADVDTRDLYNVPEIDLREDGIVSVYVADDKLEHTTLNSRGDFDLYPTKDASEVADLRLLAAATAPQGNSVILDETHFGWKIADCTQCHNSEKQPLGHGGASWPTNSADGFDDIQPYYCATCHGNNGAQEGHNRSARCFWCHNSNNGSGLLPNNHGNASIAKAIPVEDNVSNKRFRSTTPVGKPSGNYEAYGDLIDPSHNSDYSLSKTFPDPFACGTCHGFEHEMSEQ
ncbi:hypothetical protein [Ferrimonas lipolytica]|uniref:Uncharacterized protein n=1 Tax=Ferrimonas lipolytica TaxID=2724191 RepID=A0A6H1UD23_9GAMM|nr:hypothetical protein [Ferrimonas lipolytica]QIZ76106.1 hypothetical protein HER31_03895 [Ferrimonas lipolytica]